MRAALVVVAVLALSHALYAADPVTLPATIDGAAETILNDATLRVRIYNYGSISSLDLERTERTLSGIYRDAGVRIIWEPVLTRPAPVDPWTAPRTPVADVSIMLLDKEMSRRIDADPKIAGSAAVSLHGRGSIAYVHGERIKRMAGSQDQVRDILSFVMAHELSHLLLPPGAHTDTGLMRGEWTARELRRLTVSDFSLTEPQRGMLRDQVRRYRRAPSTTLLSD